MAFRTTETAVRKIIDVDEAVVDLSPFIETANALVTDACESTGKYSAARLELIERWLSAHFYAVFDPRTQAEKVDVLFQHFEGKADLGLDFTRYGQQALRLDTEGGLAILNEAGKTGKKLGTKVRVKWLGTPNCNTGF